MGVWSIVSVEVRGVVNETGSRWSLVRGVVSEGDVEISCLVTPCLGISG